MSTHAIYFPDFSADQEELLIQGDEARHANRVKRLRPGEHVHILTGSGVQALAEVLEARRELRLRILSSERIDPVAPRVHVLAALPKGPRAADLVDALVQVGATSFTPLLTARTIADPTDAKAARLERVAIEALKQSRRPWALDIRPPVDFADTLSNSPLIFADADAPPYACTSSPDITLLIGPEGGWTDDERRAALDAGARAHRFGPHVMRIETAAPAAVAVILAAETPPASGDPAPPRR